jgi:hypothetical protein
MATFKTSLSSARFAINCAEGSADDLAKLFDGMAAETARNILEYPGLVRIEGNAVTIPDEMVAV